MSGLAAGIRLAHFGKRVCIFERHNAVGGLNGFYSLRGRKYDVGLHAVTNFVKQGVRGTPLGKLLRQLRIEREEWDLCEQRQSRIAFGPRGEAALKFTNDFPVLEADIGDRFPSQIDGFRRLAKAIREFNDVSLDAVELSARSVVRQYISDPLLEEMLFCPLMYYGSAREHDMEFAQFSIMFKALFLEGFARPFEGVRKIIRVLLEKYRQAGGERRMKCGVRRLLHSEGRITAIELDSGETVVADHVLSSIGSAETLALLEKEASSAHTCAVQADAKGSSIPMKDERTLHRLSFVETISVLDVQPHQVGLGDDTIVFFNDSERFDYARPKDAVDPRSGVICVPNNFVYGAGRSLSEGWLRCTCLANHAVWAAQSPQIYREAKAYWFDSIQRSALRFLPGATAMEQELRCHTVATDMFTPLTIARYTGHGEGAIYGAPMKCRTGHTPISNLHLCGTDQGFLGIIGAMLSGISMANLHILQPSVR